ncbi:hypothetical protein H6P81_015338 [Aristolochia fimbriata]|uniref:Scarecrow-like protein 23 n=1 Tax=Aristolochia fimbriata TaxID=158543 RepID=A0AAV7E5T1_ARIFI|nr:hypothetical protein H6P81_015338 [Aristolochia fimbriata]
MLEADQDELLDLRLAVPDASGAEQSGAKKRKRNDEEGKTLEFLRMREAMLKPRDPRARENGNGLRLIHLLLLSATAIDEKKLRLAADNLADLYRNASLSGDSVQRVAAYFADGLAARLLSRESPFYAAIMEEPTREEELAAFTDLYRASPYFQFAHFTANQAIIEAFETEEARNGRSLHVIDFDVSYGFQWPSLIQSLSDKATPAEPVHLRITGFGTNSDELRETETRLVNFTKGCVNLDFKFEGLIWDTGNEAVAALKKNKNETVAVNLMFHLHKLGSSSKINEVLKSVHHSLNPSVLVLVEQEGSRNPKSFLSRFMESLHYFAAMFDSLDDCLPPDSSERLRIERNQLGREIKSMLNCDGDEERRYLKRYERLETWKGRMESVGFRGVKFSSRSVSQAKLLLKIRSHCSAVDSFDRRGGGGFRAFERDGGRALSLGWQDRHLITASVMMHASLGISSLFGVSTENISERTQGIPSVSRYRCSYGTSDAQTSGRRSRRGQYWLVCLSEKRKTTKEKEERKNGFLFLQGGPIHPFSAKELLGEVGIYIGKAGKNKTKKQKSEVVAGLTEGHEQIRSNLNTTISSWSHGQIRDYHENLRLAAESGRLINLGIKGQRLDLM